MLTLYYYDRSTAAQRVRLALEEKGIPWQRVIVDTARGDVESLPEDYHRLNPKGLVPVIIHDGAAMNRSSSSNILKTHSTTVPLRPESPVNAVVEWGDVAEKPRRKLGTECFGRLEELWNAAAG